MFNCILSKWKEILMYLAFLGLLVVVLSKKSDLHVDEMWTYNLANAEQAFWPESGVVFEPAGKPYLDYHTSSGSFDMTNVWKQNSEDCHPPFYYALVHIICTFFPGKFSIWFAGIINIFFQLLILLVLRKIIFLLTNDDVIRWIVSISYIFCAGILSISSFLRMYVMLMFWITLFAYIVLKKIESFSRVDMALMFLITTCGVLTHYHFIVYCILLSAVLEIILIASKRYKEAALYPVPLALSALTSYAIFPAMIYHIFSGQRGRGSFEHLFVADFLDRFMAFSKILDEELFGGMMYLIICTILIFLIVFFVKNKRIINRDYISTYKLTIVRFLLLLIPATLFMLIIAKTVPYKTDRYISPVYAVFYVGVMVLLYLSLQAAGLKYSTQIFAIVSIIAVVFSLKGCKWEYLYLDRVQSMKNADFYGAAAQAICVYEDFGLITPCFYEISRCHSSVFYNIGNYEELREQIRVFPDSIAFFVIRDVDEDFIEDFQDNNPEYEIVCDNGSFAYAHSYYLSKD